MKVIAEFDTVQEILGFVGAFGIKASGTVQSEVCSIGPAKVEALSDVKIEVEKLESIVTSAIASNKTTKTDAPKEEIKEEIKTLEEEPKKEDAPKPPTKITKEALRALFGKLIAAGKQVEAKALTTKYHAARLPDIKEEDYEAVYKEAEALV